MKLAPAVLLLSAACVWAAPPAKIVLIAGAPSHGPGEHEFNNGVTLLDKCLKRNQGVAPVIVRGGWPQDESVFDGARAIVLYSDGYNGHPFLKDDRLEKIGVLMRKGVGLACIHYAVEMPRDHGGGLLQSWIGGYYERPYSQNPVTDVDVKQASPEHPISRGWKSFRCKDEWYYRIRFLPEGHGVTPILTAMLPKNNPVEQRVAWAIERPDGGRGFGFTGAHYNLNWAIPEFRRLIVNAILWTAKLDVPEKGARCDISPGDLTRDLDPKPPAK